MSSQNSQSDNEQSDHEEVIIEQLQQQQDNDQKSNDENEIKEETKKKDKINSIEIQQNEQDQSLGTYIFTGEDHTFGNSIREMLAMKKEVDFVGYTIPHPSEEKIHLRLQVKGGKNANNVLKSGLKNLIKLCDNINEKFDAALVEYQNQGQSPNKKTKKKSKKQ